MTTPTPQSGSATAATAPIALSQLKPGQSGVVRSSTLSGQDAALLGAMGLCCNARVRLCRAGEPCIVAVGGGAPGNAGGCRIGLARPLADRIFVELTPASATSSPEAGAPS